MQKTLTGLDNKVPKEKLWDIHLSKYQAWLDLANKKNKIKSETKRGWWNGFLCVFTLTFRVLLYIPFKIVAVLKTKQGICAMYVQIDVVKQIHYAFFL